jgi:prevent-host-death family protein
MQTVTVNDLKNNLSLWLEKVRKGEEIVVQQRSRTVARLMPPADPDTYTDAEHEAYLQGLIASGRMRPAKVKKNNDILKMPAPKVSDEAVRDAMRWVRDED